MQRSGEREGWCVLLHIVKYDKMNQVSSFSVSIQENKVSLIRVFGSLFVSQQVENKKKKKKNEGPEHQW